MAYRLEKKIIINKNKVTNTLGWIKENKFTEIFKERLITSIYYDNLNFDLYKDSEEGVVPRKKIRIRSYDNKNDKILEKKITSQEGRFKISHDIKTKDNFYAKIYDNFYGYCYPVSKIVYTRRYFNNDKIRITIDQNIQYFKISNLKIMNFNYKEPDCVMEFKSDVSEENNLENLSNYQFARFSKYCKSITALKINQL